MSCTLAAGLSLQWFRNTFCAAEREAAAGMGADPYELMTAQAQRSPIGANRLLYLPYLMGARSPLLDSDARGAFMGLSAIHTKGDLIRAKYSAWAEERNGQVAAVTRDEIRVIWQPNIRNVTNFFSIFAAEIADGRCWRMCTAVR